MTFTKKDQIYLAHCGVIDGKPNCAFHIELNAGLYEHFLDSLQNEMEILNNTKQDLIRPMICLIMYYYQNILLCIPILNKKI